MTHTTRWIVTLISTWMMSHALYWLVHFNPIRDLSGVRGYAVDFAILVVIAYILFWGLGKVPSKSAESRR